MKFDQKWSIDHKVIINIKFLKIIIFNIFFKTINIENKHNLSQDFWFSIVL
jgi:hypothetical protein